MIKANSEIDVLLQSKRQMFTGCRLSWDIRMSLKIENIESHLALKIQNLYGFEIYTK